MQWNNTTLWVTLKIFFFKSRFIASKHHLAMFATFLCITVVTTSLELAHSNQRYKQVNRWSNIVFKPNVKTQTTFSTLPDKSSKVINKSTMSQRKQRTNFQRWDYTTPNIFCAAPAKVPQAWWKTTQVTGHDTQVKNKKMKRSDDFAGHHRPSDSLVDHEPIFNPDKSQSCLN